MADFPSSWQFAEAKQLCSELVDCINKTAPTVDFETPYKMIRTTNVKNGRINIDDAKCVTEATFIKWNRRLTPKCNDIVLTREAPLGDVEMIRTDDMVFLGQRTMLYRANPELLDQHFLYYTLLGPTAQAQIRTFGSGSTVEHVRVPDAEKITIPYPELAIQKKIAAILTTYDDLIEINKRRIALLEKMAEELYREWFVRLRFPGHQNTRFVKGVPEGWPVVRLGEVLELAYGKALKESDREAGFVPVYGSGGIAGFHSRALVKDKGIIVGRKGNVGSVYYSDKGFFPIDTVFYVISDLPLPYLFFVLKGMNFINNDAAVPGLNRNQAYSNKLYFPGSELVKLFSKQVDPIFELRSQLEASNDNLTKTRDLLLPRLISGKLSVEDLDIQFPPSMLDEADSGDGQAA